MQSVAIKYAVSNSVITKNSVCWKDDAHFYPTPKGGGGLLLPSNVGQFEMPRVSLAQVLQNTVGILAVMWETTGAEDHVKQHFKLILSSIRF